MVCEKNWKRAICLKKYFFDGAVLKIFIMSHKFQWPKEGLNCEPHAYNAVTYIWPYSLVY